MQRYKLIVEFDGTDFNGWQYQNNGRSVQGELESALRSLLSEEIRVHGAGRTDAGVHGSGMAAHIDTESVLDPPVICKGANAILPRDVAVLSVEPVADEFHARHSASSRTYRYIVRRRKHPIGRSYAWVHFGALDGDAIASVVPLLRGAHDFAGLSKRTEKPGHTYCYVYDTEWIHGEDECVFTIKANRFLYGMVRCIVGGLIQTGRGAMTPEEFRDILESKDPSRAPMLAPPSGLTLTEVRYDAAERALVQAVMDELKEQFAHQEQDE